MPALAILNPRAKKSSRRRRRAGRRPMTAKQLRYFGPRKARNVRRRAAASSEDKINPKGTRMAKRRRRNSVKRRHRRRVKFLSNPRRRYRRNPRTPGAGLVTNTLVPAAVGAAGAIATDFLMGALPIPWMFRRGPMLPITRIGLSLLLGAGAAAVWNEEVGAEIAAGGTIVTLYGLGRNWMTNQGWGGGGWGGMSRYVPMNGMAIAPRRRTMRRYVPMNGGPNSIPLNAPPNMFQRGARGLGYMNPARTSRGAMRYFGN